MKLEFSARYAQTVGSESYRKSEATAREAGMDA